MDQEAEKQPEAPQDEVKPVEEPELEGVPMDSSDMGSKPKYDVAKLSFALVFLLTVVCIGVVMLVATLMPKSGGKSSSKINETTNNQGSGSNSGGGDSGGSGSSDGGSDDDDDDITDDGTVEGKIQSILASTKKIAKKYAANYDYAITDVDDFGIAYEFTKGVSTALEKTIGFEVKPKDEKDLELTEKMRDGITRNANFQEEIKEKMKAFGLTKNEKYEVYVDYGSNRYENSDGYVCLVSTWSDFYVTCGHASWINDEVKSLVTALAKAYNKVEQYDVDKYGPLYIWATPDNIKNSPTKPYQTIEVSFSDSGGDFYRKGENSEWIYAFGGQQAPDCEEFNTAELKAAFEGGVCWHWGEDPPRQDAVKK